jgi:hypothetical protein
MPNFEEPWVYKKIELNIWVKKHPPVTLDPNRNNIQQTMIVGASYL